MSAKKRPAPKRVDKRFANRSLKKGASGPEPTKPAHKPSVIAKAKKTIKTALRRLKP